MPALLDTAARELDIPRDKIEEYWEKAKKIAVKKGNPNYAYIVGILKKMLGKENVKELGWKVTANVKYVSINI